MAEKTVYIIDLNDKVTGKLKGVQTEAKKTDGAFGGMKNMLGSLGIGIGIGTLTALAKGIYDITAGAEQTKIQFEVMLGSVSKADKMIRGIREFAAATPFETVDLEKAATTMLQFGITAEDIMPNIKMIGDIAGGNADKFGSLTLAFSQISATGRLMGQDLLQLINAGFNPLQTISGKTGISIKDLKKQMESGLISFDMVAEAFKIETVEGGRFFNMMDKQSQTVAGRMSTLTDNIKMMGLAIGEAGSGGMSVFLDKAAGIVQVLRDTAWSEFFASIFGGIGDKFALVGTFLTDVVGLFGVVGEQGIGLQHIIDSLTVAFRAAGLAFKLFFIDPWLLFYDLLKGVVLSVKELASGNFSGATDALTGDLQERVKGIKDAFLNLTSFEGRGFGGQKREQKEYDSGGVMGNLSDLYSGKSLFGGNTFAALGDGTIPGKDKTKKQGAGGLTLNESRNGATHITFNIDTFQKNEFSKDGTNVNNSMVKDFLDKMAAGLATVLNDSQIAARQ